MRTTKSTPFRVYANSNLGTQYDYSAFTGEWVNPKSTGHAGVLPEINIATGNVIVKSEIVKTKEQIGNWEFGFVYNAQNTVPWTMNVPGIVSSTATQLILSEKDGSQVTYTFDATQQAFVAPSGSHSKSLITQQSDGSFIQLNPATGARTFYNAAKQITAVYDARGLGMQYAYVGGVLSTVTSAAGVYTITTASSVTSLTFVATGDTTSQTLGTWTFDSSNRLQTATIPSANNYAINYGYNGATNQLTSITQTDGTTLGLTYTTDNPAKIETVTQGANGAYTFAYNVGGTTNTTITDPLTFITTAAFTAQNTISGWSDSVGDTPATATTQTTACTYINNDLSTITTPDTAQTSFTLNAQGLTTQITKPNNQVTQYDYDPNTFARTIKRELQSGSGDTAVYATTRYAYHNNVRQIPGTQLPCRDLRFTVSEQGCVNELRYNDSDGTLISNRTYLQSAYTDASLTPTTPIKFADLETWAAAQTASAISLSTMRENLRGARTSLREFANITSTGAGNYDDFASHDQFSNHTIWGAPQTHTEKTAVVSGTDVNAVTQDAFDGLHRLTSHKNALLNTKTIQYNDATQNAVTTEYNGRTETSSWNTAGQITSTVTAIAGSSTTRTASNSFDTAGRLSCVVGIDGQSTYQLFDSLNRPRFVMTPSGRLTEYFYDDVNHYRRKTRYYTQLPLTSFTPPLTFAWIAANLTSNAKKDATTYSVYDLSHRLQYKVTGNGSVTGYNFDLQNRKYLTTNYKTKISSAEITAITTTGTFSRTPSTTDRVLAKFYDNDNNVIATQDGDNYVTQYQRNVAGVENCRTQFATPASQNLTGIPIYPAADTEKDFSQYFYTDARGQKLLTVDGTTNANYVVQNSFYPDGKINTETKFANQSSIVPSADSDPSKLIPTSDPEDQVTTNTYDLLNRLVQQNLPQQRLKSFSFDEMGNVILQCVGDDPAFFASPQVHGTAKQFDNWGQLTQEATPLVYAKILSIQNNKSLTPAQITTQVAAVWANQALQYQYNAQGLHVAKIDIVPDGATTTALPITFLFYDADKRLVLKVGPEGQTTQITPDPIENTPEKETRYEAAIATVGLTGGFITDAVTALITANPLLDQTDQYDREYDDTGVMNTHTDAEGYVHTKHTDMFDHCDTETLPVDSTTPSLTIERQFDFRGHKTQEVKTAGTQSITTSATFSNLHGNCTSITDGNGNTTTLTHEPRGTLLTSKDANNNTTTLAHDAFERETLRTLPMGQAVQTVFTQASRKTTTSHLDSSAEHVVLSSTSKIEDAFANPVTLQDALGNSTQLFYNAANQCEMKLDANDNQSSSKHDLRGLETENNFRQSNPALFSSTSTSDYTLSRNLHHEHQDTTGLNLETKHETNALGQNYQTTTPNGNIRKTVFNQRSLATEHHKFLTADTAVITSQNYNGLKTSSAVSHHTDGQTHVYQEQSVTDGFGRESQRVVDPITETNPNGLALTHTKILDNANRLIATTDPKGQTSYVVRDAIGNIRFEINAKGGVTEHQYNANRQKIFTAEYTTAVALTSLSVGMSITAVQALLTPTDFDCHTRYYYDDAHNERFRLIETVRSIGSNTQTSSVIESRYDLNKEKIATIKYYTPISGVRETLTTATLITQCAAIRNTTQDQASYRVLDPIGQEVFVINADGTVIQKCYHSTKHKVNHEIAYATKIANPESTAALTIAEITALLTPTANDRHTYWLVDNLDRLQWHVTPTGAVTNYVYDGNTKNRTQITQFAAAITIPPTSYSALMTTVAALTPTSGVDNIESRTYDGAERESTRTNALKNAESFGYDGASRKSSHTTLSGNQWTYDYDGASRLWHEYSPATTIYSASIDPTNVTAITISQSTNTVVEKETAYDANSNVLSMTSGVGLSVDQYTNDQYIVNFAYNALNQKNLDTWNNIPVDVATQATNLTSRPESVQSVTKSVVHGANGKKYVEINEAGNPIFYAYDAAGRLQYKIDEMGFVTEYQRNALGQCEHLISYATALTISLTPYLETGLTPDVVVSNITKDPTSDRSFNSLFDQNGKVTQVTRDPVICYIPAANPANAPTVATQTPTKTNVYNTFGETVSQSIVVDETNSVVRTNLIWRDNNGNEIATVDANGIAIVYTYDTWNRKIEEYKYDAKIPAASLPTVSTTFSELQTLLATIANTAKDHDILTPRDIIGRETGIIHVGLLTQQIVQGQQAFENNPLGPQNIGVTFTYTRDNKVKTKTYPNGQVESFYYDERRNLIAKAFVPRTQVITNPDGTKTSTLIQPIIYYHVSAHGDRVETYEPLSGCVVVTDPSSEVVPLPVSTSAQDIYHQLMKDPRGNLLAKQDPKENLKQITHTVTGKVARSYHPTTNGTPTTVTDGTYITHIDEHKKTYDARDELLSDAAYRDSASNPTPDSTVAYQRNAFREIMAEGPGDGTWPVQNQFDQAGKKWSTFATTATAAQTVGPVGELLGYNAAGEETVKAKSHSYDLSQVTYSGLGAIFTTIVDFSYYFMAQTQRDPGGRVSAFVEPGFPQSAMQAKDKPKSILISEGQLSFQAQANPEQVYPKLILRPKLQQTETETETETKAPMTLSMTYSATTERWSADLTKLALGQYDVEIQHFIHAPRSIGKDKLLPAWRWQTEINWQGVKVISAESDASLFDIHHPETLPEKFELKIWFEQEGITGRWKKIPITKIDRVNNIIQFDASNIPQDAPQSVSANRSTRIPQGLRHQAVPGDGSCFFYAVGLYLGQDVASLRRRVAEYLENNIQEFLPFFRGTEAALRNQINRIRRGNEMADHLEIEALQRVTNRPVIIVRPNGNPTIPDLQRYTGEPIFVYYDDHIHYDALLLQNGANARDVLQNLQTPAAQQNTQTPQSDKHAFPHDKYRYHLGGVNADQNPFTFSIQSKGEETYLAETFVGDDTTVYPTHRIALNNFGKKSSVTTPAGETTSFTHTKLDKLETQTDPVIPVTDASGNTTNVAAVTTLGYDESGKKIGVEGPNGNTETFFYNAAGQRLIHTAGDGTPYYTKARDVFGRDIQTTSASGNTWNKTFDPNGEITQVTQPTADTWTYKRNENNYVITITPPANSVMGITAYAEGLYGDMSGHFLPMGEYFLNKYDRHHGILSHQAFDVGATTPTYQTSYTRDFSGRVTNKTDGTGSTYQISYFPSGALSQELGVENYHGSMLQFNAETNVFSQTTVTTPPLQDKQYSYLTNLRVKSITDSNSGMPQTLVKIFDINRSTTSVTETDNSLTLRATVMTYNARHFPATQTDTNFSLTYAYDPVGNRRNMNGSYNPGSGGIVATHDAWYTYDVANRVLINDGRQIGRIVPVSYTETSWGYEQLTQISPNTVSSHVSNQFTYVNGLRATQALYIPESMGQLACGNPLSATFGYDVNDRVASVVTAQYNIPTSHEESARRRAQALELVQAPHRLTNAPTTILPLTMAGINYQGWAFPQDSLPNIYWNTVSGETDDGFAGAIPNNGDAITVQPQLSQSDNWQFWLATFNGIPYTTIGYIGTVTVNVGAQFYQGALPIPASTLLRNIYSYPESITYTTDGWLSSSFIHLGRNPNSNAILNYVLRQTSYDQNGRISNYSYFNADSSVGIATYATTTAPFNVDGLPTASSTAWSVVTDNLTYTFNYFDTSVITLVSGTRSDPYGGSPTVNCPRYYDANNALNSTSNVYNPFNPNDGNTYWLYFNNSLENARILAEYRVLFSGTSVSTVTPTIYYQDARGHIVAEYGEISNSSYQTAMALQLTADPVQSLNVSDLQASSTITAAGDNYASISYKLFRDTAYASLIRATTVLMGQGQRVDAKQVIDAYNKALDYSPYEKLIQIVYNAMYPSLKTPQPPPPPPVHDESFWVEFIEIVVSIVVMVVAHYYIGPALFEAGATGATAAAETSVTYAIAGALADAASQGVAIAFDDEHGFNLKEMVMSAITTGATAGAGKYLGLEKILSDEKYLQAFSEIVATNITVQLFEMSIGLRPQLDLKLAAEQAIEQVLSAKIDSAIPAKDSSALLDNGVNEITTTGVNTAFGAPFNTNALAELAGNYVGDIAGDTADVLAKQHTAENANAHSTSAASMSPASQPTGFNTQAANDGGSGYGNANGNWNGNGNQSGNGNGYQRSTASSNSNNTNYNGGNTSNDSGINALYQAYEAQLSGSVSELANANYSAAMSSYQSDAGNYQAQQVQRSADRVAGNSSGFFGHVIRSEIGQDEFTGKVAIDVAENLFESGVGLAKMGYHLAEMTPYQTYIGLRAATTTSYHFAEALLNPETRMQTLDAAGKGISAFGIGLATKFEDASLDQQIADVITLGVPGGDAAEGAELASDAVRGAGIFAHGQMIPKFITTPYGNALQSGSSEAMAARNELAEGAWIYRGGKLGKSAGPEGQFWSLENPLNPGYAEKYGLPIENAKFDFVEVAALKPGSTFITREAPGIGINGGGGIEVVVNTGEPKLQYFHMPWEPKYDSVEQRFIPRNK